MRRFWKGIAIFLLGGVLGTGFGVALGFFFFPYVFPPPEASEQLTQADIAGSAPAAEPAQPVPPAPGAATASSAAPASSAEPAQSTAAPSQSTAPAPNVAPAQAAATAVAKGAFIHANPSDPVHWGRGSVTVYERTVFLEQNFEVGPGPKYHVYLVPKASVRKEADVKNTMFVDLGRLRAFKGSQRYPIPAGVNLKDYPSVVIWCEAFGVLISPADLMVAK